MKTKILQYQQKYKQFLVCPKIGELKIRLLIGVTLLATPIEISTLQEVV